MSCPITVVLAKPLRIDKVPWIRDERSSPLKPTSKCLFWNAFLIVLDSKMVKTGTKEKLMLNWPTGCAVVFLLNTQCFLIPKSRCENVSDSYCWATLLVLLATLLFLRMTDDKGITTGDKSSDWWETLLSQDYNTRRGFDDMMRNSWHGDVRIKCNGPNTSDITTDNQFYSRTFQVRWPRGSKHSNAIK